LQKIKLIKQNKSILSDEHFSLKIKEVGNYASYKLEIKTFELINYNE
jgi:hypothetical protein